MFKLLRYFSITSFIIMAVVAALLGMFYHQLAVKELVTLKESENVALTQAFANSLWQEFAPFVTSVSGLSGDELRAHPEIDRLQQAVITQMKGLSVVKVKVYNLAGLTVFSTEARQIGEDKSTNAGFVSARSGKVASELTHRDTFSAFEGVIENRDLISSYIPIRRGGLEGPTEAVFELYSDVTPFLQNMERTQRTVVTGVAVILTILYGVLFFIVRHADKIIKRQGIEYRRAEEQAQRQNRGLQAFNELARLLTSSLNTQEVFDFVVRSAAQLLNAKMVRLWAEDQSSGGFVVKASYGVEPEVLSQHTRIPLIRPGEGVIGRIIEKKSPEYLSDVLQEPRWLNKEMARTLGLISFAGVPIVMGDRVLGVLTIMMGQLHEFSDEEKNFLAGFADQAAVAIENARLFQETERRAQEQAVLNAIAMATSQSLHLDELLQISLDRVLDVTGREQGYIRLKDPVTGQLKLAAHRGISKEYIEVLLHRRTPGGKGDQVFESGEVLVINDPEAVSLKEETRREGRHSLIWVPLKARGKVVGLLNVTTNRPIPFAPREVELLQAIGNVIGVALENARLFGETRSNLERIRALREIEQAITSTLDLRFVLDVLLEKIDLVLPYSATTVRLLNKESGAIEPVACRNLDEKEWKAERWRGGRGIPNVVFETKAPVTISNVQSDPQNRDQEFFRKHGLVSYLGVPLLAKGEILGVISFYTKEEHEFNKEEIEFLSTLAGQAAIAIHNSGVYEEMTKLAADLSRSNKVKDEFLSVMSHELRTPLNVVMGYTGMIRDGLLGEINPEQEKALEKVISRTRDQLTMISSILQAVQMEAEGVRVERREVGLKGFLDELRSGYTMPLGKELSVIWDYPSDLPVVHTDVEKLKHVLQNLINNAIKFTEKGHVTISARPVEKRGGADGQGGRGDSPQRPSSSAPMLSSVEFKVSDTGVGIAKEHFSLIFERFRQVDSSETRQYGGVGIGLYVVKKFTELLGGKVELDSKPGKGSTFTVVIPCESYPLGTRSRESVAHSI